MSRINSGEALGRTGLVGLDFQSIRRVQPQAPSLATVWNRMTHAKEQMVEVAQAVDLG